MSEFMTWLERAMQDVECGRSSAEDVRLNAIMEWGGSRVPIPSRDYRDTARVRELVLQGTAERTARRFVRGR